MGAAFPGRRLLQDMKLDTANIQQRGQELQAYFSDVARLARPLNHVPAEMHDYRFVLVLRSWPDEADSGLAWCSAQCQASRPVVSGVLLTTVRRAWYARKASASCFQPRSITIRE